MIDISESLAAKSDQINAADLAAPITVTVARVEYNPKADQPLTVHMTEGKPWRPSKGMRRVLAQVWGKDASKWPGHAVTLYNDPEVVWAGKRAGGIRISAMTGITRRTEFPVKVNRTKVKIYTVNPIKVDAIITPKPEPSPAPAADAPSNPKAAILGWLASKGIEVAQLDKWLVNLGKQPIDDMHPSEAARLLAVLDSQEDKIRAA